MKNLRKPRLSWCVHLEKSIIWSDDFEGSTIMNCAHYIISAVLRRAIVSVVGSFVISSSSME